MFPAELLKADNVIVVFILNCKLGSGVLSGLEIALARATIIYTALMITRTSVGHNS